jgi:hypothetical protein
VDCGFHSQGKGAFSDVELVQQIKTDLAGQGLHVVVATHRHQDHISGFGETALWQGVAVDEVWLPFTASPDASSDPAFAAWERLLAMTSNLFDRKDRLTPDAVRALSARSADDREAAEFMLWNARQNAPGIENLRRGMKKAGGAPALRRYLPSQEVPFQFASPALPGVGVHVLGPARDPAYRRKRNVPAEWGVSGNGFAPGADDDGSPFGSEWRIPRLPPRLPFQKKSLDAIRLYNDDLLSAAAAADAFLNGESLVLVLEIGNARLLLPGDAEVAAWQKILADPNASALASGATFLKCGHHGSHNATPLIFLKDHLAPHTPVMMSTQEGPGRYRNNIPLQGILDTLADRQMPLARSDRPAPQHGGPFTPSANQLWIDCALPC